MPPLEDELHTNAFTCGVVGAGRMGSQIAVEFAAAGYSCYVVARNADTAKVQIRSALGVLEKARGAAGLNVVADRIHLVTEINDLPTGVRLVIESVPEDRALKMEILRQLSERLSSAVVASNTSSFTIRELTSGRPMSMRTVGIHYWYPPLLMDLVEVVPAQAEPWVVARTSALLERLGKVPIIVKHDVPGFIWNRLQFALLREAYGLVSSGVASRDEIDHVVREGLARRLRLTGPFETAAVGGPDVFEAVARRIIPTLSTAPNLDGLAALVHDLTFRAEEIIERRDTGLARGFPADHHSVGAKGLPSDHEQNGGHDPSW